MKSFGATAKRLYNSSVINLLLIFFSAFNISMAEDDTCAFFKNCSGTGKRSSSSNPSSGSSASFNPSKISSIKGFGVETLIQPNNSLGFNIVTGTGKIGGALISPTVENSFFGNRSIELDYDYLQRRTEKKRYKNKKLNLALGATLVSKKNYSLAVGVSAKRNPDIKKINPGAALSMTVGFIDIGAYVYKDDTKVTFGNFIDPYSGLLYSVKFGAPTYQETFTVTTFSVGLKIQNLSLDAGVIKARYDFYSDETNITIYSGSYNIKKFLFSAAYRRELSPNFKEDKGFLSYDRKKTDYTYGTQFIVNRHLVLGLAYNNFLLKEISGTVTLFL